MIARSAEIRPFFFRFDEYIRMFPSSWLFEHFLNKSGSGRKVLSSNALTDGVLAFTLPDSLRGRFTSLTPEERLSCSLIYLQGDRGAAIPEEFEDHLSDPLVLSFLVYFGRSESGEVRHFGFAEFEPVLRPLLAKTICEAAATKRKISPPSFRPGLSQNDLAVILALGLQGSLERKTGFSTKRLLDTGVGAIA